MNSYIKRKATWIPACEHNQTVSTIRSDRGLCTAPQCGAWTRVPLPSRCVGRHAHTALCPISTGLHSWESQNYAGHTWFSHQRKSVVADYTPGQRTQCQYFYRNVHNCHKQLIFVKRLPGASYKMFQKTLSKSLRSNYYTVPLSCFSHKKHSLLCHGYLQCLCLRWLCCVSASRKASLALLHVPPARGASWEDGKPLCGILRAAENGQERRPLPQGRFLCNKRKN